MTESLPDEPSPPAPDWPRYSARPFPAQRFVPGLTPRSRRPADRPTATAPGGWSPEGWRTLEPYLYGIDLYNFAYWWEAHEVLEELWHGAGRITPHAGFVQGIIHVAAANLNLHRGHLEAGRRQARRGVLRLSRHAGRIWMGIEVDDFVRQVEGYITGRTSRPALIRLVFDR